MFVSPACKSRDCLTVALSLFFWWQYRTWYLWFLLSVEEGKWWLRLWRHAGVLFEEVLWNYLWTAYRLHMVCFFHDAQCPNSTIHTLWLQSWICETSRWCQEFRLFRFSHPKHKQNFCPITWSCWSIPSVRMCTLQWISKSKVSANRKLTSRHQNLMTPSRLAVRKRLDILGCLPIALIPLVKPLKVIISSFLSDIL